MSNYNYNLIYFHKLKLKENYNSKINILKFLILSHFNYLTWPWYIKRQDIYRPRVVKTSNDAFNRIKLRNPTTLEITPPGYPLNSTMVLFIFFFFFSFYFGLFIIVKYSAES